MRQGLEFVIDRLDQLLAANGGADEALKHGQHRLRLFESKCAIRHGLIGL